MRRWDADKTRMICRGFAAGEALVSGLEGFARANGIREAAITCYIGSLL